MSHTPGPWKVFIDDSGGEWEGWPLEIFAQSVHEDCVVVRPGGQYPYAWDHRVSQAEAVANAALIAAAPEMLAVLEELRESSTCCGTYDLLDGTTWASPDLADRIESAIRKASGEE